MQRDALKGRREDSSPVRISMNGVEEMKTKVSFISGSGKSDINREFADQLLAKVKYIPGIADLRIQQAFNLPRIQIDVDRTRTTQVGFTQRDVANNMLVSLSGSFQTSPSFWLDPENGVSYNIAAQTPQYALNSLQDIENIPVTNASGAPPQILGNLASSGQTIVMVTHDRSLAERARRIVHMDDGQISRDSAA